MEGADEVLDFFETVALFVHKKALIEELVWHSFTYSIRRYVVLCERYIAAVQRRPDVRSRWEDLMWLHPRLLGWRRRIDAQTQTWNLPKRTWRNSLRMRRP